MQNKSELKLYNLIFPIWILWLFPLAWFIVLPLNFLIDTSVVLITLKILKLNKKNIYRNVIFKVWGFGFSADFIGTIIMFTANFIDGKLTNTTAFGQWWYDNIANNVSYNPFGSVFSILWVAASVIITSLFIYLFNYKVSFKKLDIEDSLKKKLALSLAIFTAPYLFFLPTAWFF